MNTAFGKCINAIHKFMFVDPDNKVGYFCTSCSITIANCVKIVMLFIFYKDKFLCSIDSNNVSLCISIFNTLCFQDKLTEKL